MPKTKQVPPQPQPQKCSVCLLSLASKRDLVRHSLDMEHRAEQCCGKCLRFFESSKALEDHNNAHLRSNLQGHSSKGDSQALLPNSIHCRGNNYSRLSTAEQSTIYEMLLSKCNPQDHLTPQPFKQTKGSSQPTPKPVISVPKRRAVAIDCEMVGVRRNQSEIVHLCIIDVLTGETLTNSLVMPRQAIINWRSDIHGITPAAMHRAVAQGQVLDGWTAARAELWRHIDENTVLVGQSIHCDLRVLRAIHHRIVDSATLTTEAVYGRGMKVHHIWGLKDLCHDLLGLTIRDDSRAGNQAHDSLEDALAAREVVLWCLQHPVELETWASEKRTLVVRGRQRGDRAGRG